MWSIDGIGLSHLPVSFFDALSPLRAYRLALIAGLVMATAVALLRGHRRGLSPDQVFDGVLGAGIGGLIIGRVAYVAANGAYFRTHPLEALQVWRGGVAAPGVVIGGVLGVVVLCQIRRIAPRRLLDLLAPCAAMVAAFAWLGCLGRGCSYGIEVWPDQGLLWDLHMELPDLYGIRAPRLPVQLLGIAWNGALAGGLCLLRKGRIFPAWLVLHALGDVGLGFLRGDMTPVFAGLAPVQLVDLGLALVGLFLIITWDTGDHR